jgi:acyl-CoA thioesterase I
VHRLWTVSLFVLTAVVLAGMGWTLAHDDSVPHAGQTPGYTLSASPSAPVPTVSGTASSSTSSNPSASTSSSAPPPSSSSAAHTIRVTMLGDDWALGVGSSADATPWPQQVAKRLGVLVTTVGAAGSGYAQQSGDGRTYSTLVDKVVQSHPDVVVAVGGRNDVGDDAATLRQGATSVFGELHRRLPDATLLAVAPFWGDSTHPDKLGPVDSAVRSGVTSANGTYLDLPDPLAGHPSWMDDTAHPNDRGYQAIATAMTKALRGYVSS